MRIGLVSRTDEKAISLAKKIREQLSHHELSCDEDLLTLLGGDPIQDVDVLLVIGGDGTILRTVRKYPFPLLTVKMGKHGHLCEVEPEDIHTLEDLLKDHVVDIRMKLEVSGVGEALNEVVIRAAVPDKVVQCRIEYENYTETVAGDGILISTPTGSTAYSLAAGGPVIEDDCPVLCITPICPLERAFFPRVISSDHAIKVTVDRSCHMMLDGDFLRTLSAGGSVTVKKSRNCAVFWRKRK